MISKIVKQKTDPVVKQAWNQTFLLFLIEGILIAVTIGTGMIEMLVDAALSRLAGF